jgi:hypothetical protein
VELLIHFSRASTDKTSYFLLGGYAAPFSAS